MAARVTSIKSYGVIESEPLETYGDGKVLLRIGLTSNPGATGLIQALATDYLAASHRTGSITWTCNHSRNTQLALLNNYIDLALTYERSQEALAASEGWSATAGCVFHDHFCLVGPPHDPANVRSASSIQDAFAKIAGAKARFHNRADDSATMWRERLVWGMCGLGPWEDDAASVWYQKSTYSPGDALIHADEAGAYLLTDRSTLLRQTSLETISNSTVFIEPGDEGDLLMNSCYALFSTSASESVAEEVGLFLAYLKSARGQGIIAEFGKGVTGFPFFATLDQGFARSKLMDGRPRDGKWVHARLALMKLGSGQSRRTIIDAGGAAVPCAENVRTQKTESANNVDFDPV